MNYIYIHLFYICIKTSLCSIVIYGYVTLFCSVLIIILDRWYSYDEERNDKKIKVEEDKSREMVKVEER